MALDALIFDLDGTLVDTNGLHAGAWKQALEAFGYSVGEDRIALEIGKGGDKLVPTLLGEEADAEHGEALREAHGEAYLALVEQEGVRLFPEVEALLQALRDKGLKTAIATAAKQDNLEKVLEQLDLDLVGLVDEVVTDDDVQRSKPHPDTVTAAVKKLGLAPAQCAMVGDTPYDAEACWRAGVVCLGVLTGVHTPDRMHRAGARKSYKHTGTLLADLDEALVLVSPGAAHLTQDLADALMHEALEAARRGMEAGEVPIGSVLAWGDGTVLTHAYNEARRLGSPVAHAELRALQQAADAVEFDTRDLILVSTLEPCVMCFGAALEARVDTILYAFAAPLNGGVSRCTPIDSPGAVVPRVVGGIQAEASRALLAEWLQEHPDDAFVRQLLA